MNKVVIKGYYGFGNYGDDILMLTAHKICQDIFPSSELIICTESKNATYINSMLPGIPIVNSATDIQADFLIHGGGGVFFDFTKGDFQHRTINFIIRTIGYKNYAKAYYWFSHARKKDFLRSRFRLGLGVGIGTYTDSSNKFYADILSLSSFDFLLVRDDESVINARRYCTLSQIHKASDLAFMIESWNPKGRKKRGNAESIGFILRDWSMGNHLTELMAAAVGLDAQGLPVKFFSFDKNADQEYISMASAISDVWIWEPEIMHTDDLLIELSTCRLVITSRAHGAIVSTCLGIPVLCIAIEPKLIQVAAMLEASATIIKESSTTGEILSTIQDALVREPILEKLTWEDVARNKENLLNGLHSFRSHVHQYASKSL